MTTIAFTFPAPVAAYLNLNVPGFAAASGGGDTVAVQVPPAGLPDAVVAGLNDAGVQVSPAAHPAAPGAAVPGGAAFGVWHFAPVDPTLAAAGAGAAARWGAAFGEAADAFFQRAAAGPPPATLPEFAAWAAAQQQAAHDYFFGV